MNFDNPFLLRRTSVKEKLTVSTFALFWKLTEIGKHLRDCTEDIINFRKFLAGRLDFINKPEMRPWDFVKEWDSAFICLRMILHSRISDPPKEYTGMSTEMRRWLVSPNIEERLSLLEAKSQMFAEDLCGKEFAEVAALWREDQREKDRCWRESINYQWFRINSELKATLGLHPFPPGDPVMVEEAKKCVRNYFNEPNFVERYPKPPDNDFGTHGEIC